MEGEGLKGDEAREREVILFILSFFLSPQFLFPVFLSCPRNLSYLVSFIAFVFYLFSLSFFLPFPFSALRPFSLPTFLSFSPIFSLSFSPFPFPHSLHFLRYSESVFPSCLFIFALSYNISVSSSSLSHFFSLFSPSFHSCTPSSFSSTVFFMISVVPLLFFPPSHHVSLHSSFSLPAFLYLLHFFVRSLPPFPVNNNICEGVPLTLIHPFFYSHTPSIFFLLVIVFPVFLIRFLFSFPSPSHPVVTNNICEDVPLTLIRPRALNLLKSSTVTFHL